MVNRYGKYDSGNRYSKYSTEETPAASGNVETKKPPSDVELWLSEMGRTVVPAITGTAGAMIGTGATPGVGTLAGGGLGFAIGEEVMDYFDEFIGKKDRKPLYLELVESGKQIVEGAAWEAGGQAFMPLLKVIGAKKIAEAGKYVAGKIPGAETVASAARNLPPITEAGAMKMAGRVIAVQTESGPMVVKSIKEAQALQEAIPELRFSRGQMTNDPNIIMFERTRARMPASENIGSEHVASQQLELEATNSLAIKNFINKVKGPEGLEQVGAELGQVQQSVEAGVETAKQNLGETIKPMYQGSGEIAAGKAIRGELQAGLSTAKKEGGKLFKEVPEFGIDASKLTSKLDEISQPFDAFEDVESNIPKYFEKVRKVLEDKGGVVTPKDLQGLSSNLGKAARRIERSSDPNAHMISRLNQMYGEVESLIDDAAKSGERVGVRPVETPGGATQAEIEDYLVTSNEAQAKASENIKAMRAAEDKEEYAKALNAAKGLVKESPEFAAYQDIIDQGGLNLETAHMGTDKETIKEILRRRPTLLRKGAPTHADQYANQMGFDTPDEMFQDWLSRDTRANQTRKIADDIMNEYYVGKEAGLVHTGPEEFINEEIDMLNSMMSKTRPKGWKPPRTVMEKVVTRAMPGDEQAYKKLRQARTFWKKEVIDKFKSGTAKDVLAKDVAGDKVSSAQVASRWFQKGAVGEETAAQFMDAVGNSPKAVESIKDYIKQNMLEAITNADTEEVVSASFRKWLAQHKPALKKYGVLEEFNTVGKATKAVDDAIKMQKEFNASEASKILGGNVETAVIKALGTKSYRTAAINLMNQMGGNKKAISGLQNAFIDEIQAMAKTTAPDKLGNKRISFASVDKNLRKYDSALKVFFRDSPKKMKALEQYRSAMERLQIGKSSPLGGGSDTFENTSHGIAQMMKWFGMSNSKIMNSIKFVAKPFLDMSKATLNDIFNRAALSPEYAYMLKQALNGVKIPNKFKGHLAAMALMTHKNPIKNEINNRIKGMGGK